MQERLWIKHYDPGIAPEIEVPEITLHRFLEETARKYPNRTATILKGARLSYAELDQLTDRLAAGLDAMGLQRGDRVAILMPNSPQFVIAFYGILKAGGVAVATNPLYTPRELEHQMKDSGAEFILVMSNFYRSIKQVQPNTSLKKVIVSRIKDYFPPVVRTVFTLFMEKKMGHRVELEAGDEWFQDVLARHSPEQRPQLALGPDDVALLQYTGGTTGLSKGAVGTHRNLVANSIQCRVWQPQIREGEEVTLLAIPMFHVYGLVVGMSLSVYVGSSVVMIPNPRDLKDVLTSIDKYRPSMYPGVPTMYNAINNHPDVQAGKYDLSSIQACISGSAPLMRETKDRFEALTGGKLVEGYGLTETLVATHCNPIFGENRTGSIGLPFPGNDCRIVSLDDEVTVLQPEEVGELVIRGPSVMRGYHNMPTETANTLRDGWLHTGDIAHMNQDGYFFIVDRKKDMIIAGGYNIYPRDIEEVLFQNPKVLECVAVGVPDEYRGETVKCYVVLKPGEAATEQEMIEWCRAKLAKYKVPTAIEFREGLPKTLVGKYLRRVLREEEMEKQKVDKFPGKRG